MKMVQLLFKPADGLTIFLEILAAATGSTCIPQPSSASAVHSTNSDVQPPVAYCTAHATAWAASATAAAAAAATTW